jgi:hypothetical protein
MQSLNRRRALKSSQEAGFGLLSCFSLFFKKRSKKGEFGWFTGSERESILGQGVGGLVFL